MTQERIEECEQAHVARHEEIEHPCIWDEADSLNDGCYIRYRIYREHLGVEVGHSFGPWA